MKTFISNKRHRKSDGDSATQLRATQSDRARLVYSAPFRRLQQKAQVFSMESNSAVRSRLTHSIEVAHVGRYIVSSIHELIAANSTFDKVEQQYWRENILSISNIVETACLMHDIGNPPFGHFGEAAIAQWFSSQKADNAIKQSFNNEQDSDENDLMENIGISDFKAFDGNPQGFRIITKLQGDDGEYGLNLTHTQLATFLKYTYSPAMVNKTLPFRKKAGFFSTEEAVIKKTWQVLGMDNNTRHPLGFLMEASDDISYCISDIEDGIEKRIVSEKEFLDCIRREIARYKNNATSNPAPLADKLLEKLNPKTANPAVSVFMSFKTTLSNQLVDFVANEFVAGYSEFIECKQNRDIIYKGTEEYAILAMLKQYTKDNMFSSLEAESMELSGFAIISGLLDDYAQLLALTREEFKKVVDGDVGSKLAIHRRLYNRLPSRYVKSYKVAAAQTQCQHKEWNLRAHLIVDYIAGMTDNFAMETYQMLKGIRVG